MKYILIIGFLLTQPLFAGELAGRVQVAAGPFVLLESESAERVIFLPTTTTLKNFSRAGELGKGERILVETDGKNHGVVTATVVTRQPALSMDPRHTIMARDLDRRMREKGDITVLDSRPRSEFNASHLPGALSLPVNKWSVDHPVLPLEKESPAVICGGGPRDDSSHRLFRKLLALGYSDVKILINGLGGWVKGWNSRGQPTVMEPEHLVYLLESGIPVYIIDVRKSRPGVSETLPGAVRIPLDRLTFRHVEGLVPTVPVLFVGANDADYSACSAAERALPWLSRGPSWARNPVHHLAGGVAAWKEAGGSMVPEAEETFRYRPDPSLPELDPAELEDYWNRHGKGVTFLDVRFTGIGPQPGLLHLPLETLLANLDGLSEDETYIIFCHAGERARIAAEILNRNGYTALFTRLQPPLP